MTEGTATHFEPIAVSPESTVVAEFTPSASGATVYQSEADLEREFIKIRSRRNMSTCRSTQN